MWGVWVLIGSILCCCCCWGQELHPQELQALRDIKSHLRDQPGSTFLSTWNFESASGEPCTTFSGIVCTIIGTRSHIITLNLGDGYAGSPGLTGTLHDGIGSLSLLQQLTIVPGTVTGPLPQTLGQLSSLQFLGISGNQITGCIPDNLSSLTRLQVLDFNSNALACEIPRGLARLPELAAVELAHNNLTGSVPEFTSPSLTRLDLGWNALTGRLPPSLPASLTYLNVRMNRLRGGVEALIPLKQLTSVDLSSNQLTGAVPGCIFGNNPGLRELLLQRNHFSGGIDGVDVPVRVSLLDLSYNDLSGGIPAMFAFAESVYLNNNRFTGVVPAEFADALRSANLKNLYLQHNFLTDFNLAPPDAALPAVALLCIQYNCLTPPSQSACPSTAGKRFSRPSVQCQEP